MSGEAAQGRAEQQLLASPRLDAFATAVVVEITAGVVSAGVFCGAVTVEAQAGRASRRSW